MSALGKRGSQAKVSVTPIGGDKGAQTLPSRSALMKLAKGKKTTNDYSKAGPTIAQTGPNIIEDTKE
jgi:hypothetical protein